MTALLLSRAAAVLAAALKSPVSGLFVALMSLLYTLTILLLLLLMTLQTSLIMDLFKYLTSKNL